MMFCQLEFTADRKQVQCVRCKRKLPAFVGVDAIRACLASGVMVGDCLHLLIDRLTGNKPDRKCGCEDRIIAMNKWGPSGCREHLDEITDRLVEQANKHDWKIRVPGIGSLARLAPEGVQRWSCRQLALLAIRRAERAAARNSLDTPQTPG